MEKKVGIWLDTDKAILISLLPDGENITTIESMIDTRTRFPGEGKAYHRLGSMFVNPSKRNTNRKKHQMHHYLGTIIKSVQDASDILIFGPSTTKIELEKEIKKLHDFNDKKISVVSADKMTQKQTIAFVKNHYKDKMVTIH